MCRCRSSASVATPPVDLRPRNAVAFRVERHHKATARAAHLDTRRLHVVVIGPRSARKIAPAAEAHRDLTRRCGADVVDQADLCWLRQRLTWRGSCSALNW